MLRRTRRRASVAAGLVACAGLVAFVRPATAPAEALSAPGRRLGLGTAAKVGAPAPFPGLDSLRGFSRKLRARFLAPHRAAAVPVLREYFGDTAATRAGIYAADDSAGRFHFITMRPFADKVKGRIGSYRIGFFPAEQRSARAAAYRNPEGFLEVTAGNADTPISEHFRLRDFLTKDQGPVWPKYLVLREPLVDKLELVLDELRGMGVAASRLRVMSGFRTPQYNQQGVGAGGRVQDSRHQYGDAADVYVVNGARDWMSDLNGDGRVDTRDARVLATAAERVEQKHPELVGGIGVYTATSAHGPFVHIDVRGNRARWGAL
jgi:Peptidase M15